ncbi:MAG: hypothetical protein ACK4I0_00435 [Brevundimonas sp.]|uniref:hypothetical protein n=1 Tax=Brevundimonas sp. TaxID=1871086 RepID=UPI00391A019B
MLGPLLAGILAASSPQQQPTASDPETPTRLEDIEVTGRRLETVIRDFVNDVAAPNPGRNLARWDRGVCIGAANFQAETAQYLVDRISTVADDLGLRSGAPGCKPNVLVIASSDPNVLASDLIERSPLSFRPGGSGMDRGGSQLRAFRDSDRPVRWWAVSVPTDSHTGQRAVRLRGECADPCSKVEHYAPQIEVFAASRLSTQIVDDLNRVIVIVDVNKIDNVSAQQLADYVAMVSLSQINPTADTSAYASILNVFDEPDYASSLTEWDQAYLRGLYGSQRTQQLAGANRSEVVATIRRAHSDLRRQADQTEN